MTVSNNNDALYAARMRALSEFRALTENANSLSDLDAEDRAKADKLEAAITKADREIAANLRSSDLDSHSARVDAIVGNGAASGTSARSAGLAYALGVGTKGETRGVSFTPDGVTAETRDILTTTANATIEIDFAAELMSVLSNGAPVFDAARKIITDHTRTIKYPNIAAHGSAAFIAEGGAIGESDPTLSTIEFGAWKVGQSMQISYEAEFEVVESLDIMAKDMSVNLGVAADTQFVLGDGTTEPQGLAAGLTGTSTVPGVVAPTADSLITALHSVAPQYRKAGRMHWVFADATIAAIRALKDTTDQYLWQSGLAAGQPDELLGYPIISSSDVAVAGANAKVGYFVDMDRFVVRQTPMRIERSADYAWLNDLATYRALISVDSKVTDAAAGVILTNEAA